MLHRLGKNIQLDLRDSLILLIYQVVTTLTTTLFLQCLWCDFKSEIAFDMENHLYEKHRYDMLNKLQVKSYDIEDRIQYAMELINERSKATGDSNDNNNNNESITANTKESDKE
jgi:hypothetical protein